MRTLLRGGRSASARKKWRRAPSESGASSGRGGERRVIAWADKLRTSRWFPAGSSPGAPRTVSCCEQLVAKRRVGHSRSRFVGGAAGAAVAELEDLSRRDVSQRRRLATAQLLSATRRALVARRVAPRRRRLLPKKSARSSAESGGAVAPSVSGRRSRARNAL